MTTKKARARANAGISPLRCASVEMTVTVRTSTLFDRFYNVESFSLTVASHWLRASGSMVLMVVVARA